MLRRTLTLVLLALPAFAADWVEYRSGPFHVFSDAGDRAARERLTQLEQLRFVLGTLLGWIGIREARRTLGGISDALESGATHTAAEEEKPTGDAGEEQEAAEKETVNF